MVAFWDPVLDAADADGSQQRSQKLAKVTPNRSEWNLKVASDLAGGDGMGYAGPVVKGASPACSIDERLMGYAP